MLIGDLSDGVISKLGNRSDIDGDFPRWAKMAILELTQNYPFEELRLKGPVKTFTAQLEEYPETFFLQTGDQLSDILTWFLQIDSTSGAGYMLKYRTLRTLEPMSTINGQPIYYTRTGKNLLVGFKPMQAYTTWMRYQKLHPMPATLDAVKQQQFMLPDNWQEVAEYSIALRGALDKRWSDVAGNIRTILHGDPKTPEKLGLISSLVAVQTKDSMHNERQLNLVTSRY